MDLFGVELRTSKRFDRRRHSVATFLRKLRRNCIATISCMDSRVLHSVAICRFRWRCRNKTLHSPHIAHASTYRTLSYMSYLRKPRQFRNRFHCNERFAHNRRGTRLLRTLAHYCNNSPTSTRRYYNAFVLRYTGIYTHTFRRNIHRENNKHLGKAERRRHMMDRIRQ